MIRDIVQRTEEWFAWRKLGITASVAANILGYGYRTPWQEWALYKNRIDPEDLSGNPFVQRGVVMEDYVRRLWEERHDDLAIPVCVENDANPVIRASLDGMESSSKPVEFKVINKKAFELAREYGMVSPFFLQYWVQVQHQIVATEQSEGWLAAYCPDLEEDNYIEFLIQRDDPFIDNELIPGVMDFWNIHIQKNKPPALDPKRDIYIPEGDQLTGWKSLAHRWRELDAEMADIKSQLLSLDIQKKEVEKGLMEIMGDYRQAYAYGLQLTSFQKSGSIDYKAIVEKYLPDLDRHAIEAHRRSPSKPQLSIKEKQVDRSVIDIEARKREEFEKQRREELQNILPMAAW